MSHPHNHARSSARRFGGTPDDYLPIHNAFDSTKAHVADCRHRLILHNTFGIFLIEKIFGEVYTRPSDGKQIPTRLIGEQHVLEDFGRIPTLAEIIEKFPLEPQWMCRNAAQLSKILDHEETDRESESA